MNIIPFLHRDIRLFAQSDLALDLSATAGASDSKSLSLLGGKLYFHSLAVVVNYGFCTLRVFVCSFITLPTANPRTVFSIRSRCPSAVGERAGAGGAARRAGLRATATQCCGAAEQKVFGTEQRLRVPLSTRRCASRSR